MYQTTRLWALTAAVVAFCFVVGAVILMPTLVVACRASLPQGSLLQCVMTPGDKWMPKSTEEIAAACLEQVKHLYPRLLLPPMPASGQRVARLLPRRERFLSLLGLPSFFRAREQLTVDLVGGLVRRIFVEEEDARKIPCCTCVCLVCLLRFIRTAYICGEPTSCVFAASWVRGGLSSIDTALRELFCSRVSKPNRPLPPLWA